MDHATKQVGPGIVGGTLNGLVGQSKRLLELPVGQSASRFSEHTIHPARLFALSAGQRSCYCCKAKYCNVHV